MRTLETAMPASEQTGNRPHELSLLGGFDNSGNSPTPAATQPDLFTWSQERRDADLPEKPQKRRPKKPIWLRKTKRRRPRAPASPELSQRRKPSRETCSVRRGRPAIEGTAGPPTSRLSLRPPTCASRNFPRSASSLKDSLWRAVPCLPASPSSASHGSCLTWLSRHPSGDIASGTPNAIKVLCFTLP